MFYQNQFVYLFLIVFTQTLSTPIKIFSSANRCNDSFENCQKAQYNSLSSSTTTENYPSTTSPLFLKPNRSSFNLKLVIIIVACICLGIGIVRICFLFCNSSRPRRHSLSNRRQSSIHPRLATIEQNQFKPDLPPAYAEAIANNDLNENKLPTYDELNSEQNSRNTRQAQM
ncbi:hypothetical protein I4U23_025854 [Adineta vaga]|nr:hypothetical protein I4U23_025854 [Adineta vaga]